MRASDIRRGKTYVGENGKCMTVVGIRDEYRPVHVFKEEPGVLYKREDGEYGRMYLSSFASWAKGKYGGRRG